MLIGIYVPALTLSVPSRHEVCRYLLRHEEVFKCSTTSPIFIC